MTSARSVVGQPHQRMGEAGFGDLRSEHGEIFRLSHHTPPATSGRLAVEQPGVRSPLAG